MKYYKNIIVAVALALAFGTLAYAESESPMPPIEATSSAELRAGAGVPPNDYQKNERRMEVREKVKEMRVNATSTGRMCEALAARVETRLENFGKKYDDHKARYDEHKAKLLEISAKLEAEGVATAKLKADIALLDGKIAKFEADHQKVKTALEDTKSKSCATAKEEFKSSVEAVRAAQKVVADDARDIFEFIKGTLKQDIFELRADFKAKADLKI